MAITRPGFESAHDSERLLEGFENLMPFRVNDILLVSSLYDSFILREDGRLNELLIGESLELNLHQVPGITHVSTGREAVELVLAQPRFNLIVTNLQVADMDAAQLAREIKAAGLRCAGHRARLRLSRDQELSGAQSRDRHRSHFPLAG